MHFYGLVFVKCCIILFCGIPYIEIRLALKKRNGR
jgi:hypothetical protein